MSKYIDALIEYGSDEIEDEKSYFLKSDVRDLLLIIQEDIEKVKELVGISRTEVVEEKLIKIYNKLEY